MSLRSETGAPVPPRRGCRSFLHQDRRVAGRTFAEVRVREQEHGSPSAAVGQAATLPVLRQPLPLAQAEDERLEDDLSPLRGHQRPGCVFGALEPVGRSVEPAVPIEPPVAGEPATSAQVAQLTTPPSGNAPVRTRGPSGRGRSSGPCRSSTRRTIQPWERSHASRSASPAAPFGER